jgi:hypothetical protein
MYRTWWALLIMLWPTVQGQWMRRKTAILEGDMTIGYLFSMHEQPDQKSAHTRNCGKIWEEYGIQRAEVTFQTIDQINKDDRLLPNITLGVEIRDDCWSVTFNNILKEIWLFTFKMNSRGCLDFKSSKIIFGFFLGFFGFLSKKSSFFWIFSDFCTFESSKKS